MPLDYDGACQLYLRLRAPLIVYQLSLQKAQLDVFHESGGSLLVLTGFQGYTANPNHTHRFETTLNLPQGNVARAINHFAAL